MSAENSWATYAKEHLRMTETAHTLGLWNQVCLQAHQAAAKSLKAFLGKRRRPIPQVKHLTELLVICVEANPELARLEDSCHALEKYVVPLSYPDAIPSNQAGDLPSEKDAKEAIAILKDLREALELI